MYATKDWCSIYTLSMYIHVCYEVIWLLSKNNAFSANLLYNRIHRPGFTPNTKQHIEKKALGYLGPLIG